MDLVVLLHSIEVPGVKGHRVPLAISLRLLGQDSTNGKVRAVSLNTEWLVIVQEEEHQLGGDGQL